MGNTKKGGRGGGEWGEYKEIPSELANSKEYWATMGYNPFISSFRNFYY